MALMSVLVLDPVRFRSGTSKKVVNFEACMVMTLALESWAGINTSYLLELVADWFTIMTYALRSIKWLNLSPTLQRSVV